MGLTNVARSWLIAGRPKLALAASKRAIALLRARERPELIGLASVVDVWWTHHLALRAGGDPAAADGALAQAYASMRVGVAKLSDEGLRRSGFNKVETHRLVIAARRAEARRRGLPAAEHLPHLQGQADLREPFERLVASGLRLNELRSEAELRDFLVDEATELSGAERVLMLLLPATAEAAAATPAIAGAQLPLGEDAEALLRAVAPWIEAIA